jgi:hypothetical protein
VRLMLAAVRAELAQFDPLRRGLFVLGLGVVAIFALSALECNDFAHFEYLVLTFLLQNFGHGTGADGAAAFADSEA